MKVLLISANTEQINMPVLPVGMAFVAKAAEDAGHEVSQINLMAEPEALTSLAARIRIVQPDIIGISVRNIDDQVSLHTRFLLEPVKQVVATCRQHSEAKIVLGGAGFSMFPTHILAYLGADMGIQGEGEHAFVMLLDKIKKGEDLSAVPGLHHTAGRIANPPDVNPTLDRFLFPEPDRHLASLTPASDEIVWLPFQTRRGCPLNCSYCSTALIEGSRTRKRSVKPVIEALSQYAASGFDHFFFVDNTFNLPQGYAIDLCDRMIDASLGISWRCILYPGKVNKVTIGIRIYPDTDLARHAKRIGKLSSDDNLLLPRFYIDDGMEAWLRKTVQAWMKDRPNWIY